MKLLTFDQWYEQNKDDYPCSGKKIANQKCNCENHKAARQVYDYQIAADKKKLENAGIKFQ